MQIRLSQFVNLLLLSATAFCLTACPPSAPTRQVLVTPNAGEDGSGNKGGGGDGGPDGGYEPIDGQDGGGGPGQGGATNVLKITMCRTSFLVSLDPEAASCLLTKDSVIKVKYPTPTLSDAQLEIEVAEATEGCSLEKGVLFRRHVRSDQDSCPQ